MKKITILRKQKNLSQEDLAKILNIGQSTLSGYETGCYEPDINTLIKIANYFNIDKGYDISKAALTETVNKAIGII